MNPVTNPPAMRLSTLKNTSQNGRLTEKKKTYSPVSKKYQQK
jgi:hypothetical protein